MYFTRKLNKEQVAEIKALAKRAGIKYARFSQTKKYIEIGRQTHWLEQETAAYFMWLIGRAGYTVADPKTTTALIGKGMCDVFMVGRI